MSKEEHKIVQILEDYSLVSVPLHERRGFLSQFLIISGYIICIAGLFAGGTLGSGMNISTAITALIIGSIILALYSSLVAIPSAKYGVSTYVLARHAFGRYGSMIVALIAFILNGAGWYAYETALFGLTMQELIPGHPATHWQVASIWGGIMMMITSIVGYRGINVLSYLAVPLMVILSLAGLLASAQMVGGWDTLMALQPPQTIPLAVGITITVGYFAIGAATQPDIARYAKNEKVAVGSIWAGFLLANPFIMFCGVVMLLATMYHYAELGLVGSTPNLPLAMKVLGLGLGALIVAALAQWTTNDNNLYTGSLALVNIIPLPRWLLVSITGIAGTIIAAIGIYEYWVPWLIFLGSFVPAMAGVIIADYHVISRLLRRKEYKFGPGTAYSGFDVAGLLAMFIAGYIATIPAISEIIPGAIIGLVLGFVLHIVLTLILEPLKAARIGKYVERAYGF
ncbi:MAG: cytosine permease [Desulfurococcaceae archaeon]